MTMTSTLPSHVAEDRRRTPRVSPREPLTLTVPLVIEAEVLDISAGGALVSTGATLAVGDRAQLRVLLQREPFNAWTLVQRVDAGTLKGTQERRRLGVTFTSADDNSQRNLQRFLGDTAQSR
jgi:c-di-GMP-binding flagellar brake protein YcgR